MTVVAAKLEANAGDKTYGKCAAKSIAVGENGSL